MLTFVLVGAIALATLRRGLARPDAATSPPWPWSSALGIPAQAVIGGITVLTDLNPWVVSLHLLCSLAIIGARGAAAAPGRRTAAARRGAAVTGLAWATFAAAWAVLYVGTVVTGSGPHAGDADAVRNGLDPRTVSQLHADLVFLFVGLTVGLLFALLATGARPPPAGGRRAARGRAGPGPGRLRPVRHRPARSCWWASTCSAPRWSRPASTWALLRGAAPARPYRAERRPSR